MRKLFLTMPFTAACASSIDGNWVLTEYDQDALEELIVDGTEDDPTFGGIIDVDLSIQLSINEDLSGTGELGSQARVTVLNDGSSYTVTTTSDLSGDITVEENDGIFSVRGEFEGTVRQEIPDLDVEETNDIETDNTTIDNCSLNGDTLRCSGFDGEDVPLTLTR